ncbi:MAG: hypothetical protein ABJB12_18885 [Pseudomonadota bacterium]
MIKARTWFTLLLVSVGTVASTASCGGSDEATGGSGGAAGGGIIGASGKAGATGRAGSGAGVAMSTALGVLCSADADCDTGMTCVTADGSDFGPGVGGPSQGMCTLACATNADCAAVDANSGCVDFGTGAAPKPFCVQKCTLGGDGTTADTKCQGRPDFSCKDLADDKATDPAPFCVPQCRADLECGPGLFCSPRTGLCSKSAPKGDPVGTPCDANAATNTCAGICLGTTNSDGTLGSAFCAELCSAGGGCMYSSGPTPTPGGYCLPLADGAGAGDLGFCEPTCGCTGDCSIKGDVCRGWTSNATEQELKGVLGSDGLCFPNASDSVELTVCAEGGAGGATGTASAGAGGASP